MTTYLLLLRGINVSGANIVKMADFRAFLADLGFERVETYIQSGNAVFSSSDSAEQAGRRVADAFPARFGFLPKMMLIPAGEFASAVEGNPFSDPHIDPARLHLGFMAEEPAEAAAALLALKPSGSAEYRIKGRVFYLTTPDGIGNSQFASLIEKTLKVPVTFRNWRTVLALAKLPST